MVGQCETTTSPEAAGAVPVETSLACRHKPAKSNDRVLAGGKTVR